MAYHECRTQLYAGHTRGTRWTFAWSASEVWRCRSSSRADRVGECGVDELGTASELGKRCSMNGLRTGCSTVDPEGSHNSIPVSRQGPDLGPGSIPAAWLLYWVSMTQRVGAKGQVVIPQRLRDRRGLTPGTQVVFEERPEGVLVKAEPVTRELRGRFQSSGMAKRLLEDRAAEPR